VFRFPLGGADLALCFCYVLALSSMSVLVVLVPVYKPRLDDIEIFSLDVSMASLRNRYPIRFVAPHSIDDRFYRERFSGVEFDLFPSEYFESISGYNRLMLSSKFYEFYCEYEFLLIHQTDAIVLRDDLAFWCSQHYDYIGAPWPSGPEVTIRFSRFGFPPFLKRRIFVGNGGLSLRRTRKVISLLEEFSEEVRLYLERGFDEFPGTNEDVFYAVASQVSDCFSVPDPITASRFSVECPPDFYLNSNGNVLPMGGHAWWKFDPQFWLSIISSTRGSSIS